MVAVLRSEVAGGCFLWNANLEGKKIQTVGFGGTWGEDGVSEEGIADGDADSLSMFEVCIGDIGSDVDIEYARTHTQKCLGGRPAE